jgi:hypothetical protein
MDERECLSGFIDFENLALGLKGKKISGSTFRRFWNAWWRRERLS